MLCIMDLMLTIKGMGFVSATMTIVDVEEKSDMTMVFTHTRAGSLRTNPTCY